MPIMETADPMQWEPAHDAAWDAAALPFKQGERRRWSGLLFAVLAVAGGFSIYGYIQTRKVCQAQANSLAEAERIIESSNIANLRRLEPRLDRPLELPRFGKTVNRVVRKLQLPDTWAFESAVARAAVLRLRRQVLLELLAADTEPQTAKRLLAARAAGAAREQLAFAEIHLAHSKSASRRALDLVEELTPQAGNDALFQVVAGLALDRNGKNSKALTRYEKARKLNASLHLAEVLAARTVLLERGSAQAADRVKAVGKRAVAQPALRPSARALRGLSWALDANRSKAPPPNAKVEEAESARLPAALVSVQPLVCALTAQAEGDSARFQLELAAAIKSSSCPALSVRLAFLALTAGDIALTELALERVKGSSPKYASTRVLAILEALKRGDLKEARKLAKPASTDALWVQAERQP